MAPKAIASAIPPRPQDSRVYPSRRSGMSVREASVSLNHEGTAIRKYGEFDIVQRLVAAGMRERVAHGG
jgi:hypothetical protein